MPALGHAAVIPYNEGTSEAPEMIKSITFLEEGGSTNVASEREASPEKSIGKTVDLNQSNIHRKCENIIVSIDNLNLFVRSKVSVRQRDESHSVSYFRRFSDFLVGDEKKLILSNISVTIQPKRLTVIMGGSGSGR